MKLQVISTRKLVHQLSETAIFIATAMKKHIWQFILPKGSFFCQFVGKKVVGLMRQYSLLAGDANYVSIFLPV